MQLALEPDDDNSDSENIELAEVEPGGDFPPVDADAIEQQVRRDALQHEVVMVSGGRAPAGWRIDRFDKPNGTVRLVATPPWSRRVPSIEPEDCVSHSKVVRRLLREAWKSNNPEEFDAKERRRAAWLRTKAERRGVPPVAVARALPGLVAQFLLQLSPPS